MAYITAETVAKKRAAIKAAFPSKDGWKINVAKNKHSSTLRITVMQAPADLLADMVVQPSWGGWEEGEKIVKDCQTRRVADVNVYHYKNRWQGKALEAISKLMEIAHADGWFDKSDIITDYFYTAWYVDLEIGKWNKPFVVKEA